MDDLQPQSDPRFDELLDYNRQQRAWRGLILTGAEITLRSDLPLLAQKAKQAGFEHIRIQSHGMRLANPAYCETLIAAGVDEFFISMPAASEALHDQITGIPGSRRKTLNGLLNLEDYPHVRVITNTVVTRENYHQLSEVVRIMTEYQRLQRMEFWHYWPMHEHDQKGLIARHLDVLPHLTEAIELALAKGRAVEIKNFPQCLLGARGELMVNRQPQLFIDPKFWPQFERNGFYQCVHREQCAATECLGLNQAYRDQFGDESDVLAPILRV